MVGEPVLGRNNPMETDSIPDDNKLERPGVLDSRVRKCVQKVKNEGCVVETEDGVVMQDSRSWTPLHNNVSSPGVCRVELSENPPK